MPSSFYRYDGALKIVPTVQKFNTSSFRLQVHKLIKNHMATIGPHTPDLLKLETTVISAGEDWVVCYYVTGNINLHPGLTNTLILPDTGKSQ